MPNIKHDTENKKKNKVLLYIVIANVVLWTVLAILLVYTQEEPKSTPEELAYTMAKHVITENLKSPSTAKFQPYSDNMVTENNSKYQVRLWVDSENSFGAMIRTRFIVEIEYDGKNYKLISLKTLQ